MVKKVYTKSKDKLPTGLIFILLLLGFGFISILTDLSNPVLQLGPFVVSGIGGLIYQIIVLGVIGVIFYGLYLRMKWAPKIAIYWYSFSIILAILNLVSIFAIPSIYDELLLTEYALEEIEPIRGAMNIFLLIIMGISIGINLVIINYLKKIKDFFKN